MVDANSPVVDIHTHLYPPTWISLLTKRTSVPYIAQPTDASSPARLINRTGVAGKPVVPQLHDVRTKISFMDAHKIDISVLSLGNPWLDFLTSDAERENAGIVAREINQEFEGICSQYPGRLYFFATLPITAPVSTILETIRSLSSLPHCRGVVMGYAGLGSGIDDPEFLPVLKELARENLPIFFHPNYGLPGDVFGPCCGSHGQVLPVSLGFTTETTVAVTRMYLAGIFEQIPELRIILSHAGGMLPFIAGRIETCVANDQAVQARSGAGGKIKSIWDVMRQNVYLDGIVFDAIPLRAAADAVGMDRVMFGTDHPLFPSLRDDGMYDSFVRNRDAVETCFGKSEGSVGVMGGNAVSVLRLKSNM